MKKLLLLFIVILCCQVSFAQKCQVQGNRDGVAYAVYWHDDGDNSYWTMTLSTMAAKGKVFYVTVALYASTGGLVKKFPRDMFVLDRNVPYETNPYYFVKGYGALTFSYEDIKVLDR